MAAARRSDAKISKVERSGSNAPRILRVDPCRGKAIMLGADRDAARNEGTTLPHPCAAARSTSAGSVPHSRARPSGSLIRKAMIKVGTARRNEGSAINSL